MLVRHHLAALLVAVEGVGQIHIDAVKIRDPSRLDLSVCLVASACVNVYGVVICGKVEEVFAAASDRAENGNLRVVEAEREKTGLCSLNYAFVNNVGV